MEERTIVFHYFPRVKECILKETYVHAVIAPRSVESAVSIILFR